MGIMDMVTQAAEQFGGNEKGQVAGGLMQEIQERPGGVGSIFSAFQNNGLGGLVQQWAGGNTTPAAPEQVDQGLQGTGIIESIANRMGVSPTIVKMGLAVIIPMLIHHYVSNGHVTPQGEPTGAPQPESGSVLGSILGRIL